MATVKMDDTITFMDKEKNGTSTMENNNNDNDASDLQPFLPKTPLAPMATEEDDNVDSGTGLSNTDVNPQKDSTVTLDMDSVETRAGDGGDGDAIDQDTLDTVFRRGGSKNGSHNSTDIVDGARPDDDTADAHSEVGEKKEDYQHIKNLTQGMMDLALLSANANQLRTVLESSSSHPYYISSIVLIVMSLVCQVAVGFGLIMGSRYQMTDQAGNAKTSSLFSMVGIFLITIINVFIASFSVATPVIYQQPPPPPAT